jgi:hypothetical protein
VKAINEYASRNGIDRYQAALALQEIYEQCKCSVSNFVVWAQGENLLPKKQARGRSRREQANDNETGIL